MRSRAVDHQDAKRMPNADFFLQKKTKGTKVVEWDQEQESSAAFVTFCEIHIGCQGGTASIVTDPGARPGEAAETAISPDGAVARTIATHRP